jgi:ribosomal protein S18 acetylase RimI-like enzyme
VKNTTQEKEKYRIRLAKENDVENIASLVVRLKKLNEEFDPLLKVRDDALKRAMDDYHESVNRKDCVVLVCEEKGKMVGVMKAKLRERVYYEPKIEGAIVDFYVMPEYRRKGLGEDFVNTMSEELKKRGAGLIVAEFPFQNKIASTFYQKLGFRPVIGIFGRED